MLTELKDLANCLLPLRMAHADVQHCELTTQRVRSTFEESEALVKR